MHLAFGCLLVALAWFGLRRSVGAAIVGPALWLDATMPAIGFALLLAAAARPVFAAVPIIAAASGLVLTDRVKRDLLREPVVFADRAELLEVVRHPRLYIPFAGPGLVIGGAIGAVAGVALLGWLEPPLFRLPPMLLPAWWLLLGGIGFLCFWVPARPRWVKRIARYYESQSVSRDPAADMARFGMLATFIIHATIARAERPERQRLASPAVLRPMPGRAGPIVIVQSESWFDVGRLHPGLRDWLPGIEALRHEAVLHGRLAVPAWGANTVRSEFAVLTGLREDAVGLDRFNPYAAFARIALPSIAWHARNAGYRTVCVHPFDLTFYGRDTVLPLLGFDRLIGPEAFRHIPRGGGEWVCDLAVGQQIAKLLADERGRVLVFAITMEGHGPFDQTARLEPPLHAALEGVPGAAELSRYLHRLRGADALLPLVARALKRRGGPGCLVYYGDHQPGLPRQFAAMGLDDPRSDYLIWSARARVPVQRDLAAHELGGAIMEVLTASPGLLPIA